MSRGAVGGNYNMRDGMGGYRSCGGGQQTWQGWGRGGCLVKFIKE